MLIGSSGVGKTFTKDVIEAMTSLNEVLSLSIKTIHLTSKEYESYLHGLAGL